MSSPPAEHSGSGGYQPSEIERHSSCAKVLISKVLDALSAPSSDFIEKAVAWLGWDSDPWTECHDEWMARTFTCPYEESDEAARNREIARMRKQRERLDDWQGLEGNPILIEMIRRKVETAEHPVYFYRSLIGDLLNDVVRDCPFLQDCPQGSLSRDEEAQLNKSVKRRVAEFKARFEGTARRDRNRRRNSPESNVARAATLRRDAYFKTFALGEKSMLGSDAAEADALDLVVSADLEKFPPKTAAKLALRQLARTWPDLDLETRAELKPQLLSMAGLDYPEMVTDSAAVTDAARVDDDPIIPEVDLLPRRTEPIGVSISEFIETEYLPERQAFQQARPSFDKNSRLIRHTSRNLCPICEGQNCVTAEDGGMTICRRQAAGAHKEVKNGAGWIHLPDGTRAPYIPPPVKPRAVSVPPDQIYAAAAPLMSSAGAKYLNSRGVPTDAAITAGVRYHNHWPIGRSVVFALRDQDNKIVALQSRAISNAGDLRQYNDGRTGLGVFCAPTNALEFDRVAICEAPIDALVLWAAGLPAIATCGDKNLPEWITSTALVGKDVLPSQDADLAGDEAAGRVGERLQGRASVLRFRPTGGKDWAEIAEREGLDAVRAQVGALERRLSGDLSDNDFALEERAAIIEQGDKCSRAESERKAFDDWRKTPAN
jgi:hypothetical protein